MWDDFINQWGEITGDFRKLCQECRDRPIEGDLVVACECEGNLDFLYNVIRMKA